MSSRRVVVCLCIWFGTFIGLSFYVVKFSNEINTKNKIITNLNIRLNTLNPQLKFSIENVGLHIKDIIITDSTGKEQLLSNYMINHNKMLICRYSMRYCQECVDYAISTLRNGTARTYIDNILFISDNDNPRVSKMERNSYDISGYHFCNCDNLEIPAENVMFPYYLIIDSGLRINGVYFPNKTAKELGIDSLNIRLILESLAN